MIQMQSTLSVAAYMNAYLMRKTGGYIFNCQYIHDKFR